MGFLGLLSASAAVLRAADTPHPFILWTREEAAALAKQVQTEPWARQEYEAHMLKEAPGVGLHHMWGQTFNELFRYQVMGDAAAGASQKKTLLSFVGTPVDGAKNSRPWTDHYLTALRYDVLYNDLTAAERQQLEDTFRRHIDKEINGDNRTYTKTSWLPNMQWPRKMSAHLLAAAMQDEQLMRGVFNSRGGVKYYFDDYLSDGANSAYNEDFGKQYSMNGAILLWGRACKRLGLNELGYGYTGKRGATIRGYIENYARIAYPKMDLGSDRPRIPALATTDHAGIVAPLGYITQQNVVVGAFRVNQDAADEEGAVSARWTGNNMNGRDHQDRIVDKMLDPLWYEIASQEWPDGPFAWLLVQMRAAGQEKYQPSLLFGQRPIGPTDVKPPAARSICYPQRGVALLKAQEGPQYWDSPAPAVGVRLASPYVHEVPDVFSIKGFYAFGHPIYLNRQCCGNYASFDSGWSDSIRKEASVMVDGAEPRTIGVPPPPATEGGDQGLHDAIAARITAGNVVIRSDFADAVKFVAVRASGVYAGVEQERALFLTREYLVDIFQLDGAAAHDYVWAVHPLGTLAEGEGTVALKPSDRLTAVLYPNGPLKDNKGAEVKGSVHALPDEKSCAVDADWALQVLQTFTGADMAKSLVGPEWFDKKVGVRLTMLGEPATTVFVARTPPIRTRAGRAGEPPQDIPNEFGGISVFAQRHAASTTFVALHEPFSGGKVKIETFRRIGQNPQGMALAVAGANGSPVRDRILLQYGQAKEPLTLSGEGEIFTFTDRAYVRIGDDKVEVVGNLRAMALKVAGQPKLLINGKEQPAALAGGVLSFGSKP